MHRAIRVALALVLLGAGLVAYHARVTRPPDSDAAIVPAFGVFFTGPADPADYKARYDAFSRWVKRPNAPAIEMYKLNVAWDQGWGNYESPFWLGRFNNLPVALLLPPFVQGASPSEVVRGAYDEHYRRLADKLIAHGHEDAVLSLAHEFNTDWFPWGTPIIGDGMYVRVYRHVVDVFRSRPGANFRFDWNPVRGGWNPLGAYPGDGYVDVVSTDLYDIDWEFGPWQGGDWYVKRWNKFLTQDWGLNWLASFAASHRKEIAFPEWGLVTRGSKHDGGGDNPYFVEKFHEWVMSHDVLYHAYHNASNPGMDHYLDDDLPRSAETFRRLFSEGVYTPGAGPAGGGGRPAGVTPNQTVANNLGRAYWTVTVDGEVDAYNGAPWLGDLLTIAGRQPAVAIVATPSGNGYWIATSDGGIFSFGDAPFLGSMGGIRLNQPIIDMQSTGTGAGYFLVASDGGVFTFGDARFAGSTGALRLQAPITDFELTADAGGYWLAAQDGGVFSFGNAPFRGSAATIPLNGPISGITSEGDGYHLVGTDGGVFSFGAPFLGSLAGQIASGVSRIEVLPGGSTYLILGSDGSVQSLGQIVARGDAAGERARVIAFALR